PSASRLRAPLPTSSRRCARSLMGSACSCRATTNFSPWARGRITRRGCKRPLRARSLSTCRRAKGARIPRMPFRGATRTRKRLPRSWAKISRRPHNMPRLLKNLRIDEVSAVMKSAGVGTKVVIMKRDTSGDDDFDEWHREQAAIAERQNEEHLRKHAPTLRSFNEVLAENTAKSFARGDEVEGLIADPPPVDDAIADAADRRRDDGIVTARARAYSTNFCDSAKRKIERTHCLVGQHCAPLSQQRRKKP